MRATSSQLETIRELGGQFFGRSWREDVDSFCHCQGDFQYTGIAEMDHLQAMWLIRELQIRVQSLRAAP